MKKTPSDVHLIIGASETDADLFYATRFLAPDPFIYLKINQESVLLLSDLELDRARDQAQVDTVLSITQYQKQAEKFSPDIPIHLVALHYLLRERKIETLTVPRIFPIEAADFLRSTGFTISFSPNSFFPQRECKSRDEIEDIRLVQQHAETAMEIAINTIRKADTKDNFLYQNGELLTSRTIKKLISVSLMDNACTGQNTIVACGDQACDPHNQGSGPLHKGKPIIIDIFPRSDKTGYFADITRTIIKGEPTDDMKQIYSAVLKGQIFALNCIQSGINGHEIHQSVVDLFESLGYTTGECNGRIQGFFHGTGHGVGLEIHEPPRIGENSPSLQVGNVVTVEPGLYYPNRGAVRIEDLVVVTKDGCENLTSFPKNEWIV